MSSIYLKAQEPNFDQSNASATNAAAPKFKFADGDVYNFGTIKRGQKIQHKFEFTNAGKEPLSIINVSSSCGCTVPEWPKKPVLPGKKAVINVTFNSENQLGDETKFIYIQSNAVTKGDFYMLYLKGNVIK